MKTYTPKSADISRAWQTINAADQILGRVSTQAATFLMGKHKPTFSRHMDVGDHVVILNAEKIVTTGNKETQKVYTRHSGYPGGLRQIILGKLRAEKPDRILYHAVSGMLPKNKLRDRMLKRLHLVIGPTNPYAK